LRLLCQGLLICLAGMLAASVVWAQGTTSSPRVDRHVVLVSIDGLAASYFDDPRANMPTLRKLAAEGVRARGMLTSFPSVTWPSHTSLVTGVHPARHGVIGNNAWDRKLNRGVTYIGDPEFSKDQAVKVPTIYDAAHAAGLTCAGVVWPCTTGAASLKWAIPDSDRAEIHTRYTTPGLAEELREADVDLAKLQSWGWNKDYSVQRDQVHTEIARFLLRKHRVNLVLLHLVNPDGVEHAYGPHTPPAYEAVEEADRQIARLWATLQEEPLAGKSTLIVVSDHGFAPYTRFIRPNALLKQLGLLTTNERDQPTERKAWCVPQGGSAFVYVLDEGRKAEILVQLKRELAALEGVTAVLDAAQFTRLGTPPAQDNPQGPDLVLLTGPGYSFAGTLTLPPVGDAGGLKGTHGHDPTPPYMHATFIAAGAGLRRGVTLELVRNLDVAPTIAALLGLSLTGAEGRVLTEALQP
jgi:predicted AlkP superfamily pyrophosphatase or phosphodiesterase